MMEPFEESMLWIQSYFNILMTKILVCRDSGTSPAFSCIRNLCLWDFGHFSSSSTDYSLNYLLNFSEHLTVLINFKPIHADICCLLELLHSFTKEIQSVEQLDWYGDSCCCGINCGVCLLPDGLNWLTCTHLQFKTHLEKFLCKWRGVCVCVSKSVCILPPLQTGTPCRLVPGRSARCPDWSSGMSSMGLHLQTHILKITSGHDESNNTW